MTKTLLVYSVLYWLLINYNIVKTECVTFYVDGYLQRLALRVNSQVPLRVILLVYQSLFYLILFDIARAMQSLIFRTISRIKN